MEQLDWHGMIDDAWEFLFRKCGQPYQMWPSLVVLPVPRKTSGKMLTCLLAHGVDGESK